MLRTSDLSKLEYITSDLLRASGDGGGDMAVRVAAPPMDRRASRAGLWSRAAPHSSWRETGADTCLLVEAWLSSLSRALAAKPLRVPLDRVDGFRLAEKPRGKASHCGRKVAEAPCGACKLTYKAPLPDLLSGIPGFALSQHELRPLKGQALEKLCGYAQPWSFLPYQF